MTLEELRDRVLELEAMERRLQDCLGDVRQHRIIAAANLEEAARNHMRLRPIGERPGKTEGFVHGSISNEQLRDAVVKLQKFTASELGAELGCSTARARRELERVMHIVRPDGSWAGRQMWAYVAPDGPGEAFKAQQRLRVVEPSLTPGGSGGAGDVKQSILSMISDKEIKKAVRDALADGWELAHVGGKHPLALVKDGHRDVTIASSPKNSGDAAKAIRRQVRAS